MSDQGPSDSRDSDAAALLMLFQSQPQRLPQPEEQNVEPERKEESDTARAQLQDQENGQPKEPQEEFKFVKIKESVQTADVSKNQAQDLQKDPALEAAFQPASAALSSSASSSSSSSSSLNDSTDSTPSVPNNSKQRKSPPLQQRNNPTSNSPGPAAAALATSNNSNIKAVVAAAALAAAAATPMPLMNYGSKTSETEDVPVGVPVDAPVEAVAIETEIAEVKIVDIPPEPLTSETDVLKTSEGESVKSPEAVSLQAAPSPERKVEFSVPVEETPIETIIPEKKEKRARNVRTVKADESSNDDVTYRVDPDAGIIGCACGYDYDDGFTIQCDRCYRWQHAICMNINTAAEAPEEYLCYLCDKTRDIDPTEAKKKQQYFFQPKRKRSNNNLDSNEDQRKKQATSKNGEQTPAGPTGSGPKERKPSNPRVSKSGKNKKIEEDEEGDVDISVSGYQAFYYPIVSNGYKSLDIRNFCDKLPTLLAFDGGVKSLNKAQYKKMTTPSKFKIHVKTFSESSKQKFMGISRLGLFTGGAAEKGDIILELLGELEFKQEYTDDTRNHYRIWGCPKPKVIFHPTLPIAFDCRGLGNLSRFIRKSCIPNCEVVTFNVGGSIKFGIAATKALKSDTELTLPWEWDVDHPIRLIASGKSSFDSLGATEKQLLIDSVESILASCECGCSSTGDCSLYKVRKASSYLLRSTRKSGTSAPDETERDSSSVSTYMPIHERLQARDTAISKKIEESGSRSIGVTNSSEESSPREDAETGSEELQFFVQKRKFGKNLLGGLNADMLPHRYRMVLKSRNAKESDEDTAPSSDSPHSPLDDLPVPVDVNTLAFKTVQLIPMEDLVKGENANIKTEPMVAISAAATTNAPPPALETSAQPKKKLSLADYKRTKSVNK
ncbi:unnamed protein product [Kuraishia capsulata CBS 1993]|uniref:SET domain-containing protein n=1 Tax=Kuraishia capsulata CBS 1993 TaxID=1382522 RepID=W6MM62_9ASCO|nr:uncharacterized protein KUCA_T00003585001 [Kuraishia capsulata CBS 1993]CDK27606.1 unnamed protein product [Kuraishia capsulata CBS 1993]